MTEPTDIDDSSRDGSHRPSGFARRDYLRMVGVSGVVGVGSSAFAGAASADSQPQRTLTIEGTGPAVQYDFTVEGSVTKSTAMGANINSNDTISGSNVSGEVGASRDSYAFTGEVTEFSTTGDVPLYLNGEPLSDTVTIEHDSTGDAIEYELRVDGEVLKSTAMSATINGNDEVTPRNTPGSIDPLVTEEPLAGESYALGEVGGGGTDSYVVSGEITGFHAEGSVNLYVNGAVVQNPDQFVRNTLTFESPSGEYLTYEFSTSGAITKSMAMGAGINGDDTVDNGNASGGVGGGRDSYAFTGEITAFTGDEGLRVYLNGEEIDAGRCRPIHNSPTR